MVEQTSGKFFLREEEEDGAKYLVLYIKMMADSPYCVSACKYNKDAEVVVYEINDMAEEEQAVLIDKINSFYGTNFKVPQVLDFNTRAIRNRLLELGFHDDGNGVYHGINLKSKCEHTIVYKEEFMVLYPMDMIKEGYEIENIPDLDLTLTQWGWFRQK